MTFPREAPAPASDSALQPIIGTSLAMKRVVHATRRLAATDMPMVFVGQTGTGKELFAQHAHAWSGRSGALIPINCGALPRDLIEGMLFGARRGVFTGAVDAAGMIEAAHRGSLFLDELDSLSLEGQVKLLRVLEERLVWRLGESSGRSVNVRFIGAAQEDLRAALQRGALRRDLYQRVVPGVVVLPSLAERGDDLWLLASHFAALRGRRLGRGAARVLARYDWPGNVRELHGVIQRAAAMADDRVLSAATLCEAIDAVAARPAGATPVAEAQVIEREAERRELLEAGRATGWDAARMAVRLGLRRSAVYYRAKRYGLFLRELRNSEKSSPGSGIPTSRWNSRNSPGGGSA